MARTKRSKQIAQFLGRQSPLPGMPPSRGITPSGMARSGQVNTTGNARQGRHFDLIVKGGRTFHNYGNGEVYEVGLPVQHRHAMDAAHHDLPQVPESFNRRDNVSVPKTPKKGRKKLVTQFVARNQGWKF